MWMLSLFLEPLHCAIGNYFRMISWGKNIAQWQLKKACAKKKKIEFCFVIISMALQERGWKTLNAAGYSVLMERLRSTHLHLRFLLKNDQAAFLQHFTFGCESVYPVVQPVNTEQWFLSALLTAGGLYRGTAVHNWKKPESLKHNHKVFSATCFTIIYERAL